MVVTADLPKCLVHLSDPLRFCELYSGRTGNTHLQSGRMEHGLEVSAYKTLRLRNPVAIAMHVARSLPSCCAIHQRSKVIMLHGRFLGDVCGAFCTSRGLTDGEEGGV